MNAKRRFCPMESIFERERRNDGWVHGRIEEVNIVLHGCWWSMDVNTNDEWEFERSNARLYNGNLSTFDIVLIMLMICLLTTCVTYAINVGRRKTKRHPILSLKYLFARCRLKTKLWKMSYRLVLWLFFLNEFNHSFYVTLNASSRCNCRSHWEKKNV